MINGYVGNGTFINPCTGLVETLNHLFFRPCNNVTRGQLAKIDSNAAGYADNIPSTQQTFDDVLYGDPFWLYIERVYLHGVISGYTGDGMHINECTGQVEILNHLYPDYPRRVEEHLVDDPLASARRKVVFEMLRKRATRYLLHVTHKWGGGIDVHVAGLCDYKVRRVEDQYGQNCDSSKIASRSGALTIVLEPATKVISNLRRFVSTKHRRWLEVRIGRYQGRCGGQVREANR